MLLSAEGAGVVLLFADGTGVVLLPADGAGVVLLTDTEALLLWVEVEEVPESVMVGRLYHIRVRLVWGWNKDIARTSAPGSQDGMQRWLGSQL